MEESDFSHKYFALHLVQFIKGIQLGNFEDFEEQCRIHLNFSGEYYVCCVAQADREREPPPSPESLTAPVYHLLSRDFPLYHLPLNDFLSVFIINLREEKEKQKLKDSLEKNISALPRPLYLGLGRVRKGMGDIWKSYSDGMTALAEKGKTESCSILDSDLIDITYTVRYGFSEEKRIINFLGVQDRENLMDLLHEIVRRNRESHLSHKHMNILFTQLFNTGIRFAAELGLDMKKVSSEWEQKLLFNTDNSEITDYEEKLGILKIFFERIMFLCRKDLREPAQVLVERVVDFVRDNFHNNLYPEKVAAHLGLSAKYISHIFKEQTGISLIDHISTEQIEHSKCLLLHTNENVDDIGKKVGIANRVTFYRLFVKHEGISPSAFRKKAPPFVRGCR